jgi:hypothetical protein
MASIPLSPVAPKQSILQGEHYRITILTDGLIRFEWSNDGEFEDRASTFATNRDVPAVGFEKVVDDDGIQVLTSRFHLSYDEKPFSPSGLNVLLRTASESLRRHSLTAAFGQHSSRWRHGIAVSNLGGTTRTLDDVNGRCKLDEGVLSRVSAM